MIAHADAAHPPILSVVVVVYVGGRGIKRALESLERQEGVSGPVEIIVALAPGSVSEQTVHSGAASARVLRGPQGAHPAELRALGVRLAAAPIVACTEDHCIPAKDWCACILAAHESPAAVIGGAIEKLQPDTAIAWTAYLLDYGRYMRPLEAGPAQYLSDCNVSYKREVLEALAPQWRDAFHETRVHDAVRELRGAEAIVIDPAILVMETQRPELGPFLKERFAHGRLFARLRSQHYNRRKRILYSLGALILAPLLVWRAVKRAWRRSDTRWGAVRALPQLLLAAFAWSIGESAGAVMAAGRETSAGEGAMASNTP